MSFLARSLSPAVRYLSLVKNLKSSIRAISVTPHFGQQTKLATQDLSSITQVVKKNQDKSKYVFNMVNQQLNKHEEGRMFAVVHLCGKQFKITSGDIILVEGYWPPTIGDEIRLEKVLLAGANDFTLIGAPLLEQGMVDVKATIIEKTLAHTKTHFKKKRRKQYLRINFQRSPNTMIRINSIEVTPKIDESSHVLKDKRLF